MTQEILSSIPLGLLGAVANQAACSTLLQSYQQKRSAETLRRQAADLALFENYLAQAGHLTSGLKEDLARWVGVSYGIVAGFQQWQFNQGYAIGSINVRMATIKTYCQMANQAEYVSSEELSKIRGIENISRKDGRNIDEKRPVQRVGCKKADTLLLSEAHVDWLKRKLREQSRLSQDGARDSLLFCLLADHGLRCGEIADLETKHLDPLTGKLVFYRRKVAKTQIHKLTADTFEAARQYLLMCHPQKKLFDGYASARTGKASTDGLTTRAINKIVARLGNLVGVQGLSPHDLRHYWATTAIQKGTDVKSLQQAGGWNSPSMPLRYAEESAIANEGVKL